ncbi:glutaredoxin family protein [Oceanobacillus jeddahense]|uniref:Glutaredoxin family protein n=1 Tax=Oceanobacillus jeddahense TaxID=1462527 RepID=A0ABY5JP26_9BACI|nr:glutaredoxin family protein [Oceanobacillus jeddahense]UUI02061.1 glutaredoxin family protein [Oceanobacillus jeddahense]
MIKFYTKTNCLLCEEAKELLDMLNTDNIPVKEIDIYQSDTLLEKYQLIIPVIAYKDGEVYGNDINIENINNLLAG